MYLVRRVRGDTAQEALGMGTYTKDRRQDDISNYNYIHVPLTNHNTFTSHCRTTCKVFIYIGIAFLLFIHFLVHMYICI